jgi:hypothetical protein
MPLGSDATASETHPFGLSSPDRLREATVGTEWAVRDHHRTPDELDRQAHDVAALAKD